MSPFGEYGWSIKAGGLVWDYNKMFQVLFLILGLLSIGSGLSDGENIQGTLLIKQNKADESTLGASFKVSAAINSAQYNNILHQAIQVVVPQPRTACRPVQIPESFNGLNGQHLPVYFLVSGEQDCSYARKVQNAKKGLAKGVIIVDSPKGINNLKLRLNDRDLFVTLLISESDGQKLIKSTSFIGELTMGDRSKERKNEMEIWVSSLNGESYRILREWSGVLAEMKVLQKEVTWMPRFAFYSCGKNEACDKSNYVSSCACGGEFCSPEQHGSTSNVLIREDIRQHLIFKQYPEKYLPYVKKFSETCFQGYSKTLISDDCAAGIMHELQIDTKINTKIDNFLSSCDQQDEEAIFQLYKVLSLDRAKYSQIGHYPTVILNHEQLQFRNQEQFKNAVCRKLSLDQQSGCGIVVQSTTIFSKIVSFFFYFLMITLLLGAGGFVVLFFRNKLRREMNKELKMQVSTAVEHYFTLSEAQH